MGGKPAWFCFDFQGKSRGAEHCKRIYTHSSSLFNNSQNTQLLQLPTFVFIDYGRNQSLWGDFVADASAQSA
jgi:hypothetical protein